MAVAMSYCKPSSFLGKYPIAPFYLGKSQSGQVAQPPRIRALFWGAKKSAEPKEIETNLSLGNFTLTDSSPQQQGVKPEKMSISVVSSISEVSSTEWDACALDATGPEKYNPFLAHDFLSSLEESASAVKETGWFPSHIIAKGESGSILGVVPLYLKSHSYGEFVFDHSWADAYYNFGSRYYPKLQCCVPFTPVTGPRILIRNTSFKDQVFDIIVAALTNLTAKYRLSSLHITFPSQNEWNKLSEKGFLQRIGMQYHWKNRNYKNFDEFLMDMKQSKRKNIRQERKKISQQNLTMKRLRGDEIKARHWDSFYDFYRNTTDNKWGTPYLTRDFFHKLGSKMGNQVLLVVAEEGDELVAGALNLIGGDTLFGRLWGCHPRAYFPSLHFEACYYQAIEAAIELDLNTVEAGAQGEHKIQRGYMPVTTYSCHYLMDEGFRKAIQDFLVRESTQVELVMKLLHESGPFKEGTSCKSVKPNKHSDSTCNATNGISRTSFPVEFLWGSAGAAYQFEGAANEGGRKPSIWDTFCHKYPEKISDRSNGDVAIDSYHRWKEDVGIVKDMGWDAYRFSISWSRVLPNGKLSGGVNKEGIQYYKNLINELVANGIKPFATIFHWDMPQALEDEFGGFLSPNIVNHFRDYAELCFREFGDKVKHWITINEPLTYSVQGYAVGGFAPGRCSNHTKCGAGDSGTEPYLASHYQLLSHAAAFKVYKEKYQASQKGVVGITLNAGFSVPYSDSKEDKDASLRAMDWSLGWFMDPLTKGEYPKSMQTLVGHRLPHFRREQSKMVKGAFDFIGMNYYSSSYGKNAPPKPGAAPNYGTDGQFDSLNNRNGVLIGPMAASDWLLVYPRGFLDLLLYTKRKYKNPLMFITENGVDEKNDPKLTLEQALVDKERISYYEQHLHYLLKAIKQGVNVKGFFAWSLFDNFEWTNGYTVRFGIYYVDYKNGLKRHPKLSAHWFKNFLKIKKPEVHHHHHQSGSKHKLSKNPKNHSGSRHKLSEDTE